ncbi:MAG TPA: N-acetylmuramoyl-L-alanine amidase [Candidatus Kapabacteria bacterium]|nr:N-acetylmuramoyl-L-alanine amidase [Candidatus Kapabacteria bacterium]
MIGSEQFFGIVRNGDFHIFAPQQLEGSTVKLTCSSLGESQSPENDIINLTKFEGKIIEVSGHENAGWIYSAKVEEEAGPVLSNFLKRVFLKDEVGQKRCVLVIGHENQSPGIINKNKYINELEFNEKLFKLIEEKVNHTVIYKVQGISYIELPDDINELDPDFIVSLQYNVDNGKTSGTEVLYYQISEAGKKIAEILLEHLSAYLDLPNRGIKAETKNDKCGLLFRHTTAPCVIAKTFFMDNDNDVKRAMENLEGLADAFAKAIDEVSKKVNLEHEPIGSDVFI